MYQDNTATVWRYHFGDSEGFTVQKDRNGISIASYTRAETQPTEQETIDLGNSQGFADWEAKNGGDPTLTARRIAKEAVSTPAGKLVVALISKMAKAGIIPGTKQQILDAILAEVDLGEAD